MTFPEAIFSSACVIAFAALCIAMIMKHDKPENDPQKDAHFPCRD